METAMADPNNIPQQVEQLSESLNSSDNQTKEEAQEAKEAKAEVLNPNSTKNTTLPSKTIADQVRSLAIQTQ